jgi:hypothetical protein
MATFYICFFLEYLTIAFFKSSLQPYHPYRSLKMAPQLGLGHTSASSYHPSKGESMPATRTAAEAEALKATLPKAISLDSNTATIDQIVEAMKVAGGLVIRNAVSHEALDQIESKPNKASFLHDSLPTIYFAVISRRSELMLAPRGYATKAQ